MKFIDMFIEDCRYYDIENLEIKTILKNVRLKGKTILDIGAGIGRLSFPLSKHAKKIIALDKDKRFCSYFKNNKNEKVEFVNKRAEIYLKNKKFDIILLAWPTFDFSFVKLIKNVMGKDSLLIFITCDNNSDYETIIDKLDSGKGFKEDIENKLKFIESLPREFRVLIKKEINTAYTYPDEATAFRVIKNSMKLWFNTRFDIEKEKQLTGIINDHKKENKIIFKEKIYFYVLRLNK